MTRTPPPIPADVRKVFDAWPSEARAQSLTLRALIYATAERTPCVGMLEEALRWGEPAYLTSQTRSGSTVRLGWKPARPQHVAIYFHCRTGFVVTFRTLFPREFAFEGNRAILLGIGEQVDRSAIVMCIAAALRYNFERGLRR